MSVNIQNARRHVDLVEHRATTDQKVKELKIALNATLKELERLNVKVARLEAKSKKA